MVRIIHREYITDVASGALVSGATVFTIQSFPVNPGLFGSFPWLCTIGGNFMQYKLHGLKWIFKSTYGQAVSSTNAALGIVVLRHVQDPTQTADTALSQMFNAHGTEKYNPSVSFEYAPDLRGTGAGIMAIRTGAQPAGTDLRMYDLGYLEIATQGLQLAGASLGQLFVEYDVELIRAQYIQSLMGQTVLSSLFLQADCDWTNANPLGTGFNTFQTPNFIGLTKSNTVITFPLTVEQGSFFINVYWRGSAAQALTAPLITFGNSAIDTTYMTNGTAVAGITQSPLNGIVNQELSMSFVVIVTAPGNTQATVTFGGAGVLPGGTSNALQIVVTQINTLI